MSSTTFRHFPSYFLIRISLPLSIGPNVRAYIHKVRGALIDTLMIFWGSKLKFVGLCALLPSGDLRYFLWAMFLTHFLPHLNDLSSMMRPRLWKDCKIKRKIWEEKTSSNQSRRSMWSDYLASLCLTCCICTTEALFFALGTEVIRRQSVVFLNFSLIADCKMHEMS